LQQKLLLGNLGFLAYQSSVMLAASTKHFQRVSNWCTFSYTQNAVRTPKSIIFIKSNLGENKSKIFICFFLVFLQLLKKMQAQAITMNLGIRCI